MELEGAHRLTFWYQPFCYNPAVHFGELFLRFIQYLKHICKGIPRHSHLHLEKPVAQQLLCAKYLPIIPHISSYTVKKTSAFHKKFRQPEWKAQDQRRKINISPSAWMFGPAPTGGFLTV